MVSLIFLGQASRMETEAGAGVVNLWQDSSFSDETVHLAVTLTGLSDGISLEVSVQDFPEMVRS